MIYEVEFIQLKILYSALTSIDKPINQVVCRTYAKNVLIERLSGEFDGKETVPYNPVSSRGN